MDGPGPIGLSGPPSLDRFDPTEPVDEAADTENENEGDDREAQAARERASESAAERQIARAIELQRSLDARRELGAEAVEVQTNRRANEQTEDRLTRLRDIADLASRPDLPADAGAGLGEEFAALRDQTGQARAELADLDISSSEGAAAAVTRLDGLRDTLAADRALFRESEIGLAASAEALSRGTELEPEATEAVPDAEPEFDGARQQAQELADQIRSSPAVAALATRNAGPVGVLGVLLGR